MNRQQRTAIYCRLSRDDGDGESMSIATQKQMLRQYAREKGWTVDPALEFVDDGASGTNFDREGYKKLEKAIIDGKVNILLTKDLSRLGREYLQTGYLTEIFFPEHSVRYIAVNDGVDTAKSDNEIIPFKNILNELYAKDNSKKVRSAYRQKALNGEFTAAFAPYGYEKSKADKHKLVIDEAVAPVVRKIFHMAAGGKSPYQIAMQLRDEKVLTPRAYTAAKYERYQTAFNLKHPYDWSHTTIVSILKNRAYLGHMVNNKSTTKSFKCKKIVPIPQEQWIDVRNTHEPLVSEELFELAQKVVKVKKRATKDGDRQIFSGLLKCSTCGRSLSYARQKDRSDNGNFACNLSRQKGKEYCSFHYIGYDALYRLVLTDLQRQTAAARENKAAFVEELTGALAVKNKKQLAAARKEQSKLQRRLDELNAVCKKLYEDNALQKISDEQYFSLAQQFSAEQKQVRQRLTDLQEQLDKERESRENIDRFTAVVNKYIEITELTAPMLNQFIEKIVVYDAEKVNGKRTQRVDIYYRFIGKI